MMSITNLKSVTATFLVLPFLVAGCAPPGSVTNTSNTSGRYLQFRDAGSNIVVMQMTLPNSASCVAELFAIRYAISRELDKQESDELDESATCSSVSVSQDLRYRATLRVKQRGYLIDFETLSLWECTAGVNGVMDMDNASEMFEVAVPCKEK